MNNLSWRQSNHSNMAQRKRAGLITPRSLDRNELLLLFLYLYYLRERRSNEASTSPCPLVVGDCLNEVPAPQWFAASQMKYACIAFQLPPFSVYRTRSGRLHRADTPTFEAVTIKTSQDLTDGFFVSRSPLVRCSLAPNDTCGTIMGENVAPPLSPNADDEEIPNEEIDDDSISR